MSRAVNVGAIGVGRIGTVHAQDMAFRVPKSRLVAVADANADAAKKAAQECGIKDWYSDYRELLKRTDIEAVTIATPTHLHLDPAIDAAEAGKHALLEKPLAYKLREADEIIGAFRRAGVKLQVGHHRRYDPDYLYVKKIIDSGEIGKPVMIKTVSRDPDIPAEDYLRASGGLILDLSPHDLDVIRWLMKSEMKRVYSETGALVYPMVKQIGDVDCAMITVLLDSGAIGCVDAGRNSGPGGYDIRAEVLGTEGSVIMDTKFFSDHRVLLCKRGIHYDTAHWYLERFGQAYLEEVRQFIDCIIEDKEPKCTGEDGRKALEASLAAAESAKLHQPINLPFHPTE